MKKLISDTDLERVLVFIMENTDPRHGGCPLPETFKTGFRGLSPGNVTFALLALEAKGLISLSGVSLDGSRWRDASYAHHTDYAYPWLATRQDIREKDRKNWNVSRRTAITAAAVTALLGALLGAALARVSLILWP